MSVALAQAKDAPRDRLSVARRMHWALSLLCALVALASMSIGPADVSLWAALGKLLSGTPTSLIEQVMLWDIRAPRTVMGLLVGASLGVGGAVMQGLFRNPLADPGLVGVSAGAGLGAIAAIVLGTALPVGVALMIGAYLVPFAAFVSGWLTVFILYRVSTRAGRTSVATMLLAGIAFGALTGAISGLLVYRADDQQLRDLTFWGLGSLAGASWVKIAVAGPIMLAAVVGACFLGRGLNGLALGEATAGHIGIDVQRMKNGAILTVAGATGAAVAVSGGIGFIGIVVPHLLRLATGPDHRALLINSALLGGALLLAADLVARTIISPAELPIGIVTAIVGGPVFLWILLRRAAMVDL